MYVYVVLVSRIVKFVKENVVMSTNHLEITLAVDWEVKHQTKQIRHRFKAGESKKFNFQDKTVNNFLPPPTQMVCLRKRLTIVKGH